MGLIRFLLACGVVLCHTSLILGYTPLSGNLAVQCFYIISGFYMSLILNEKYVGKKSNFLFYSNRALKIYPIYWINLILLIIWSFFVFKKGALPGTVTYYHQYTISIPVIAYFIMSNILVIGLDWLFIFGLNKNGNLFYTSNFNNTSPKVYDFAFNSIAWTVGAELLFYVFAPFVVRKNLIIIVILLILSLFLRIILGYHGYTSAPWDYMFFPTQIMFFMGGVLSYHLYKLIKDKEINKKLIVMMYLFFVLVICLYYQFFEESYLKQAFLFSTTILLIPASFILTKNYKIDRYFGDLSYPIYISQSFFIRISNVKLFPKPLGHGATVLLLVIVFSMAIEHFITKPLEKYRQKRVIQNTAL